MSTKPPGVPGSRLKLRMKITPESTVVNCSGRLTADVVPEFKQEIRALIPKTKRLVLDLKEVVFIDSSGLGGIISVYVTARNSQCELQLANVSNKIRDLLGMTKLLSVFEIAGEYGRPI